MSPVVGLTRHIVHIDLLREGSPSTEIIELDTCTFHVSQYNIGWDFATAEAMIKKFDGHVDAIAISGINPVTKVAGLELHHKASERLLQAATRTPIYSSTDVRKFFADWTLGRNLKANPHLLRGRKILLHSAILTPTVERMERAGANLFAADLLTMVGMPLRIKGLANLRRAFAVLRPAVENAPPSLLKPSGDMGQPALQSRLRSWISEADVFVTFGDLIDGIGTFDVLEGKTVLIDALSRNMERRLRDAGVGKILKLMPDLPDMEDEQVASFAVLHAIIDQLRQLEDGGFSPDEYMLRFIEKYNLKAGNLEILRASVNRCAFIIHPLASSDISRVPQLTWLNYAPKSARQLIEKALARAPALRLGEIRGIRSNATGQEVVCDVYGVMATPGQLLAMDENTLYDRLVQTAEKARADGAAIIGLGAYTKVAGDAGLSVARRSPIPVTNGNSYSAAATLWAAREMVIKMGFVQKPTASKRLDAKAMVIGATGSIGRVSAHLLALAYNQLVLVATRPARLLELRDEILAIAPGIDVRIRTDPSPDLPDCDLIVTATSNQSGRILDIEMVKPGAVICDCSRPLDISADEAGLRPDVLIIESGEIDLPGEHIEFTCDIDLPEPSVYACLAETVLLSMEGRLESFSLGKELSLHKVKEIYKIGLKHGARLSQIRGPRGIVTDESIDACRRLAEERLKFWHPADVARLRRLPTKPPSR